jgi:hypothetical protein
MSELPVKIETAREDGDVDTVLTITMSVYMDTDLERFLPYLTDELQTLSHDTFKRHWDKPEPPAGVGYLKKEQQ